jgi:hypothetical protein
MVEIGGKYEDPILNFHFLVQAKTNIMEKIERAQSEETRKKLSAQLTAVKKGEKKFFENFYGRKL